MEEKQVQSHVGTGGHSPQNNESQHRRKRSTDPDEMSGIIMKKRRSPPHSIQTESMHPVEPSEQPESPVEPEPSTSVHHDPDDPNSLPPIRLLKDLETRSITVAQLIQEVKGIYAGLGKYSVWSSRI